MDNTMKAQLVRQLTYYFSDENLENDTHMKANMDPDNYLPITMIASFYRVLKITNSIDIELVTHALRECPNVEVQGWRVRPKQATRGPIVVQQLPPPQMFQVPPPPNMFMAPPMLPVFQHLHAAPKYQISEGACCVPKICFGFGQWCARECQGACHGA